MPVAIGDDPFIMSYHRHKRKLLNVVQQARPLRTYKTLSDELGKVAEPFPIASHAAHVTWSSTSLLGLLLLLLVVLELSLLELLLCLRG